MAPVTRGARLASFFWTQSMVRSDVRSAGMLLELDQDIQRLRAAHGDTSEVTSPDWPLSQPPAHVG